MVQESEFISFGELLEETHEEEEENQVLERIKLLAQELLPDGWTSWKVVRCSKEKIFGSKVDPQTLNKIRFALPSDQLARAFFPETTHISERAFREIKIKLLDWTFSRALITSPPSICNKIRGSAAATELFNAAVKSDRPSSRREANRALSVDPSTDVDSEDQLRPPRPKKAKIDKLEERMETMFTIFMDKLDSIQNSRRPDDDQESDREVYPPYPESSRSESPESLWQAPGFDTSEGDPNFDFLPEVKEAEPAIPKPSEEVMAEGMRCQRFGSEAWNRIRYKDVAKRLQAAPVFSALKVNPELYGVSTQASNFLTKQDGVLGTIVHGLLCQRKHLAEGMKKLAKKFPDAADDIKAILSEGSEFKATTDDLLQFVCAHRSETIEMRRKSYKPKSESLAASLHGIPPSATHIFEQKRLSEFIKDSGGSRIFHAKPNKFQHRGHRQDGAGPSGTSQRSREADKGSRSAGAQAKDRQPTWHTRPTQQAMQRRQPATNAKQGKRNQRQQRKF